MKKLRYNSRLTAVVVLMSAFTVLVSGQSTRTWVSGVGNDANPCSRTAPCKTFADAVSKTAPGGEVNCLDAGDFGTLVITHAITIDCGGAVGSIFSSLDAIDIDAGASDVVTIRNLSISSAGAFSSGIAYNTGRAVHVENVRISGPGICINGGASAASLLTVDNVTLSDCGIGIAAGTSNGTAVVNINNTRISNSTFSAVLADNGSRITIRDSTIYSNQFGVRQNNGIGANLGSTVTVVNSTLGYNFQAALQSLGGDFILAFGNTFVNDVLAFNPNGGTIFTGADNNNSGSAPGTANGGTVPKI